MRWECLKDAAFIGLGVIIGLILFALVLEAQR